jgi:hypothetical protein
LPKDGKIISMNKTIIATLVIGILAGGISISIASNYNKKESDVSLLGMQTSRQNNSINKENCLADECLLINNLDYPVGKLNDNIKKSLDKAIQDEYKARSTYEAVIKKFGSVRPFSMIIRAEEQHINSLKAIYDKYGVDIPEEKKQQIVLPETLKEVCSIGVKAEIDNVKLYKEELLQNVSTHEDIVFVFTNLMNASQDKHLPAFERCAR